MLMASAVRKTLADKLASARAEIERQIGVSRSCAPLDLQNPASAYRDLEFAMLT